MNRDALRDALAARMRRLAPWALVPLAYLALREALTMATREDGLITPEGTVNPGLVLLAAVVMALRLATLFVVPSAVVFRLVVGWSRTGRSYSESRSSDGA